MTDNLGQSGTDMSIRADVESTADESNGATIVVAEATQDRSGHIPQASPTPAQTPPAAEGDAVRFDAAVNPVIRLPAGTVLDQIEIAGQDIVLKQSGGRDIIIANGVAHVPTLYVGGVEVPSSTLMLAFDAAGVVPGAGPGAQPSGIASSGGNFSEIPGDVGSFFKLTSLLPPTELTFPTLEQRDVGRAFEPEAPAFSVGPAALSVAPSFSAKSSSVSLAESALNARGSDPSSTSESQSVSLSAGGGTSNVTGFKFAASVSALVSDTDGKAGNDISWLRMSDSEIIGRIGGVDVIRLTLQNFVPGLTGTVDVVATLLGSLAHPDGSGLQDIDLGKIGVVATSDAGDATLDVSIKVSDDAPSLEIPGPNVQATEGGPPVGGTWTLKTGADGVTSVEITINGQTQTLALGGDAKVVFESEGGGALTVRADKTWSFVPGTNLDNSAPKSLTFTIKAVDGDNDSAVASREIVILDGGDPTNPPDREALSLTVDDQNLADGTTPAGPDSALGSVSFIAGSDALTTFAFAAGIGTLDAGLTWTRVSDTLIEGFDGATKIVSIKLTPPIAPIAPGMEGSVIVTVTLHDNYDSHPEFTKDDDLLLGLVRVVASDQDGDSVTSPFITVSVSDDLPTLTISTPSLVDNGLLTTGFIENGNAWGQGSVVATGTAGGWTISSNGSGGGNVQLERVRDGYQGMDATGDQFMIDMDASALNVKISQVLSQLANGEKYDLTFEAGAPFPNSAKLEVWFGGVKVADVDPAGPMQSFTVTLIGGSGAGANKNLLEFREVGTPEDNQGTYLANIRVSDVIIIDETKGKDVDSDEIIAGDAGFAAVAALFAGVNGGADAAMGSPQYATGAGAIVNATPIYGADGPAANDSLKYALTISANGVDSGLTTTEGKAIYLFVDGSGRVIGLYDSNGSGGVDANDKAAFAIAIDANGVVSVAQFVSLNHPITTSADEGVYLKSGVLSVKVTATDGDNDQATQSADISNLIRFEDDGPKATGSTISLKVDEGDVDTAWSQGTSPNDGAGDGSITESGSGAALVTGSLSSLVSVGSDEPATFGFAANAIASMELLGLYSKQTALPENGLKLTYSITTVGDSLVLTAREPDTNGPGDTGNPVFTLTLNKTTGAFEFGLYDELIHTAGDGKNFDLRSNNGSISGIDFGQIITVTDKDGDSINLGGKFTIEIRDDIPKADIDVGHGAVTHDETVGTQNDDTTSSQVAAQFGSLVNKGNDLDVDGSGAIGYARSDSAIVSNDSDIGADSPPLAQIFSLTIAGQNGANSGLFTTEGDSILLFAEGNLIVGRVGSAQGLAAFAVAIGQDGHISVAQYLSLRHNNVNDPDDTVSLSGKINAVLTVTDSDGDSVADSVGVGDKIKFDDDGPKLVGHGDDPIVDEDDIQTLLSQGTSPNDGDDQDGSFTGSPNDDDPGPAFVSGSLADAVNFGSDGKGGFSFAVDRIAAEFASLGLKTHGVALSYAVNGAGDVFTATAGQNTVFELRLDKSTGAYEFRLFDQLDHDSGDGQNYGLQDNVVGDVVELDFGDIIRATDKDGDSVLLDEKLVIKIRDDVPEARIVKMEGAALIHDETPGNDGDAHDVNFGDLPTAAQLAFNGVSNPGDDLHVSGSGAIGYAAGTLFSTAQSEVGADEPATTKLTLSIQGGNGTFSGLYTTENQAIKLYSENGLIVGRIDLDGDGRADSGDNAAFAIHVDASGKVSVVQYLSIKHDDAPNDHDEHNDLLSGSPKQQTLDGKIVATVTITDFDGDKSEASINIGSQIRFEDDGPTLSLTSPSLVDNGLLTTGFIENGNAWGQGSGVATDTAGGWTIGSNGAGGGAIQLERVGDNYLGMNATGDQYMIDMDASARNVKISQQLTQLADGETYDLTFEAGAPVPGSALLQVWFGGEPVATIDPAGPMQGFTVKLIEGFGDGSNLLEFREVGAPEDNHGTYLANIRVSDVIIIDETQGVDSDSDDMTDGAVAALFSGVANKGTDAGMGSPQFATGAGPVVNVAVNYGADGAKAGGGLNYALTISTDGVDSGLKTTEGKAIHLFVENGIVVGRYDSNGVGGITSSDKAAFAIAIDATGKVSIAQYVSLQHPDTTSADEGVYLNSGVLSVKVTATDGDNDQATASSDISNRIRFEDDGPNGTSQAQPVVATVEEDGMSLAAGDAGDKREGNKQPGDTNADDQASNLFGSLSSLVTAGADNPVIYGLSNVTGSLPTLYSHGVALTYAVNGNTLTATGLEGTVFTLTVNADGSWTFDLDDQLDHVAGSGENLALRTSADGSASTSAIDFSGLIVATDADGDKLNGLSPGSFKIEIQDDAPVLGAAPGNLIVNGGFETLPQGGPAPGQWAIYNAIDGWTSGADGVPFEIQVGNIGDLAPMDNVKVELDSDTDGNSTGTTNATIQQTIANTVNGQSYELTFWYAPRPNDGPADSSDMQVLWNGGVVHTITSAGEGWQQFTIVVTATGPNSVLAFQGLGLPNEYGAYLDNVSLVPVITVDEDGLVDGNHDTQPGDNFVANADGDNNEATATGSLNISWGADSIDTGVDSVTGPFNSFVQDAAASVGDRSVTFTNANVGFSGVQSLTSMGQAISTSLSPSGDKLIGMAGQRVVFEVTLSDDGSGKFRFVLHDQLDHAPGQNENDIVLSFNFTATDSDGDSVSGTFKIGVDDDMPVAYSDADSVKEDGPTVADGNVLAGSGGSDLNGTDGVADVQGADGAVVTAVSFNNNAGALGQPLAGAYGSLVLLANGSYVYTLNNANATVQGLSANQSLTETFSYEITDGDGDKSTTTLTITINGTDDGVTVNGLDGQGAEETLYEQNLADGSAPSAPALTQTGSFSVTAPDGLATVTVNGVTVVSAGALTGTLTVDTPLGLLTITGFTPTIDGGTFTYSYLLQDNSTVAGTSVFDNFTVTVTDVDGSTDDAVLNVEIVDDAPLAKADADSVKEDGPTVADGNVLAGSGGSDLNGTDGVADVQGADGAVVTAVSFNNNAGALGQPLAGAYGSLVLLANGSYVYTLNNANATVQGLSANQSLTETFSYEITDGDGDKSTTTLTITINGTDDGVTVNGLDGQGAEETLYEQNLADGSAPSAPALTQTGSFSVTAPDGLATVTVNGVTVVSAGALTGTLTVDTPLGLLTITGFTPTIDGGTFTYSYLLQDNSTVAGTSVFDNFTVTVTDVDGSTDDAVLNVEIVDDVPTITVAVAGPADALVVDETTLVTDATANFADNFTTSGNYGADNAGTLSTSYQLSVNASGAASGLFDVATGQSVHLFMNGSAVEGRISGGEVVFTLSVNGSGVVTLDQMRAVSHPDGLNPDDQVSLTAANLIALTQTSTIIDGDGDATTSSATIDIGQNLTFKDDGPTITANGTAEPTLTVDETNFAGNPTQSFASNFTSNYGADGAGTIAYTLTATAGASGLVDTATGQAVNLSVTAGGVVEGRTASGNDLVFTVSVNSSGVVTLDQIRSVVHPVTSNPDDAKQLSADNLIKLMATITDKDGDANTATIDIGQNLTFKDDGPTITANGTAEPTLTVDETNFAGNPTQSFASNFTSNYGADGAGTIAYTLTATAGASGLVDTATGQAVNLSVTAGGVVEGRTASGNDLVFTVSVNSSGVVTLDQIRSVVHPVTSNPDDAKQLSADNLIKLMATITDKDGDANTATIDIGQNLTFKDDGPTANSISKSLTETGGGNTNLMFVLDVSGSMGKSSGLTGLDRLAVMKASVVELLEQYDNVGDVKVQIVTFSSGANAAPSWMSVADAINYVNGLTANGSTDYDAAVAAAQAAWSTGEKIGGAQGVLYFLSDGEPNESNGTGSNGIVGNEVTAWQNFLNGNDINAYAYGMGSGSTQNTLDPLAYDGRGGGSDRNGQVITDLSQLTAALAGSVIQPASGSLITDPNPDSAFGADGGYVRSITYGGQTFTYNAATDALTATGSGSATHSFNTTTNVLTVTTPSQGILTIDMDNGAYTYTPPQSIASTQAAQFGYTLIDGDGDTASSTLAFNISNFDLPPIVRNDLVITNAPAMSGADTIVIPHYALLYNDSDPDGQAITIAQVSNLSSGSITNSPSGSVTFAENSNNSDNGGTFVYTGSTTSPPASDTATVTIDRSQRDESSLDGTGLGEILLGRDNAVDTINGYEGNDVLIGLGGNDTLNGGAGNDLLSGGVGADVINGVDGVDTADYSTSAAAIRINLDSSGNATNNVSSATPGNGQVDNSGDANGDDLTGIENLVGGTVGDYLAGNDNANVLVGNGGNDALFGEGGADRLVGGAGQDTLSGGSGTDTFVLDGTNIGTHDLISDYNGNEGDRIDLSQLFATFGVNAPTSATQADALVQVSGNSLEVDNNGTAAGGTFVQVAQFSSPPIGTVSILYDANQPETPNT